MDKAIERRTALPAHLMTYAPPSRWTRLRKAIWRERLMYLLILPGVIYFCVFNYLPLIGNINADQPELGPIATDEGNAIYKIGIDDPSANLFSPTAINKSSTIGQIVKDGLASIVTGRDDISKLDGMISDWKNRGGDDIRKEYEEAYAKNKQG